MSLSPHIPLCSPTRSALYRVSLTRRQNGSLGLNVSSETLGRGVLLVSAPDVERPSELRDVTFGDVIVAVDGQPTPNKERLRVTLAGVTEPVVTLTMLRSALPTASGGAAWPILMRRLLLQDAMALLTAIVPVTLAPPRAWPRGTVCWVGVGVVV